MDIPTALDLAVLIGRSASAYREASDVERVTENQDFFQHIFDRVDTVEEVWADTPDGTAVLSAVRISGVTTHGTADAEMLIRTDDPFPWRWTIGLPLPSLGRTR